MAIFYCILLLAAFSMVEESFLPSNVFTFKIHLPPKLTLLLIRITETKRKPYIIGICFVVKSEILEKMDNSSSFEAPKLTISRVKDKM